AHRAAPFAAASDSAHPPLLRAEYRSVATALAESSIAHDHPPLATVPPTSNIDLQISRDMRQPPTLPRFFYAQLAVRNLLQSHQPLRFHQLPAEPGAEHRR